MHNKRIIIWSSRIDNLIKGKGKIDGLTIQLMLWANVYAKNGWEVKTFTRNNNNNNLIQNNIQYIYLRKAIFLAIIFDQLIALWHLIYYKPNVVIHRGAGRNLFILSIASKVLGFKLIQMLASNSDVKVDQVLIKNWFDRELYKFGLKNCLFFIAQNTIQKAILLKRYKNAKLLVIPNIWLNNNTIIESKKGILWVSNFRALKRPTWFLDLAKKIPNEQFIMVGGPIGDENLYNSSKEEAKGIINLNFMGPLSLAETNKLFQNCKLFICTSEIEGFPNTFLQAFSNNVPIISTFDPSDLLKNKQLGMPVNNIKEIIEAINKLNDSVLYTSFQKNIEKYFEKSHDPQSQYNKIINLN